MSRTVLILDLRRAKEFRLIAPMLHQVALFSMGVWPKSRMEVASIHRTEDEEDDLARRIWRRKHKRDGSLEEIRKMTSRIHTSPPPHRTLDVGGRILAPNSVDSQWKELGSVAGLVNRHFVYDPARPHLLVAYAKPHGTAPHMHLQIHPKTRRA